MIRLPWQRRADDEAAHRMAAEQRRDSAEADWPVVRAHAADLRHEKELNGWTATILSIFHGRAHP